jgi:flagellar biosynthetic protein FliO
MLAALAVVIALMIVAMVFIKKYFLHSLPRMDGGALINVVSTYHLSPKNSLLLIEVLGQLVLVGISSQQISMLSRIDDPNAMEKIKNVHLTGEPPSESDPLARCKTIFRNMGNLRKGW